MIHGYNPPHPTPKKKKKRQLQFVKAEQVQRRHDVMNWEGKYFTADCKGDLRKDKLLKWP